MPDEKEKDKNEKLVERTKDPFFIRKDIQPSDVLKRSKHCKHGNVWGRCPEGC